MKNIYILLLLFVSTAINAQTNSIFTVTSLIDDNGSIGTLRWAINQANSDQDSSTVNFDSSLSGTITLTSNLPNITSDLTIVGSGKDKIAISGDNAYLMFSVNSGFKLVISSLTLKNSGQVDDYFIGTLLYANKSTIIADDLLITDNNLYYFAIYSKDEGSLISISNSSFTNNSITLFGSDYGNTPLTTESDGTYTNRIEVKGSTFSNNNGSIFETQRFVKIDSCTFTENSGGIGYFLGLNRYQVLNSTFINNSGWMLFYFNSQIESGWGATTLSDNHHLFSANTFSGNSGTVINTGNFEEQQKTTITKNTFINNGTNWTDTPKVFSDNYLDNFIVSSKHDLSKSVIVLTMSRPVYSGLNSSGLLDVNDFQFELTGGNATLASNTPSSISINGNVITLGIKINGLTTGKEVLKIVPVLNSIFDSGNNIATSIQENATLKLKYFDQDLDGIADFIDQCPDSPRNLFVDDNGCSDSSKGVILAGQYATFTKSNYSDHLLPINQDYITKNVILTRGINRGLINIAKETRYKRDTSPSGTLWAKVPNDSLTTAEIKELKFVVWENAFQGNPPGQVNETFMVYLPQDKIYFYLKLLSWSAGDGGGFSYERTGCQSATIDSFSPTSGEEGTEITIKGSNFDEVANVLIGGVPVKSFVIDSPAQITAIVALGSEGKVAIWGNCKIESKADFSYNYKTPIITRFSPLQAGPNERIEIVGSNFLGATMVKFGGVHASDFSVESDNKIIAYINSGATGAVGVSNPQKTGFRNGFTFLPPVTKAIIGGTNTIHNIPKNASTIVDSTLFVSSDGIISDAKIQITGGFVGGISGDSLQYHGALPDNFSFDYDPDKGLMSIYGSGNANVWQSILRKVAIKTTNSLCLTEQRFVTFNLGNKLYNPQTKHWYEYFPYGGAWTSSKAMAPELTYFGKVGYLATVTSPEENAFIWKFLASRDSWLGGSDNYEEINAALGRPIYPNNAASEGKYYWVTGPESGTQFSDGNYPSVTKLPGQYSNWADLEPNDLGGESYLHYYTNSGGLWNDLANFTYYLGTLVEFGGLPSDDNSSVLNFTKELKIQGSNSGSITGGGLTICNNSESVTLTLVGNTGTIVRWEYSLDNFYTPGIEINNTSNIHFAENLTQTTYFRAVIACDNLNETFTSSVSVVVNHAISGNIKAENNTVCVGGNVKFTLSGNHGDVIKWQVSNDENVWADIANTTNFLSRLADSLGTFYYRAVVQIQGCGSEVYTPSYPISVQAGQAPVGGTITNKPNATNPFMSGLLTLTGYTGEVSKWELSVNGGLTWNDVVYNVDSVEYNYIDHNVDYRALVVNGTCGLTYSNVLSIKYVPNSAAYYIGLSSNSVNENSPKGATLAFLTSTDTDAGDSHTYALVSGKGDTNNSSFEIIDNKLILKDNFDFEKKKIYSIRLRSTDALNATFERFYLIDVNNVNEAPTSLALSASSIDENSAIGTLVAQLSSTDVDAGDSHTYTLVAGSGYSDNSSFEIVGNELKVKENLDFEKKSSYSIRVRTTDAGLLDFEDTFTISINDVNEAPTSLALSASSIDENSAIGTVLANLSSTDQDAGEKYTYTLVAGSGDTNNSSFEIVGNEIKVKESFDFEKKSSYSIRVRTTDAGLLSFEDTFSISVNDVNEAPTALALSTSSINENSSIGTVLATLSSADVDSGDSHTYTLVSGTGSTNNSSFEIVGNELKVKESFDFEKKSSYSIRVRTTDSGLLSYDNNYILTVKDVNEAPTVISASKLNIYEGNSAEDLIGLLSTTDEDGGDVHSYTLVSGTGSTDNGSFKITNGQLRAAQVFSYSSKNTFTLRIRTTDKGGLSYEQVFAVTISQKPVLTGTGNETYPNVRTVASTTPSISLGYSSDLYLSGSDIVSYSWSPSAGLSSTTISNPVARPKTTSTYTVEVTNRFGSKTSVSITIVVREDFNITPGNMITPNGDGQNDQWLIENLSSYPNNKVTILDRSGRVVYTKSNYTNDWNGQFNGMALPEDTYYFIILLNGGIAEKKGFITIVK